MINAAISHTNMRNGFKSETEWTQAKAVVDLVGQKPVMDSSPRRTGFGQGWKINLQLYINKEWQILVLWLLMFLIISALLK